MDLTHPKDAEIKELYLSGKSIREVSVSTGIGKGTIERTVRRLGISRLRPQNSSAGREKEILALARLGYGFKVIRKKLGISGNAVAIKALMKKHGLQATGIGLKEANRQKTAWKLWRSAEIDELVKAERNYERAIRKAYPTPSKKMDRYYANLDKSRAKSAAAFRKRWARLKHTPQWKAKVFARNQLRRIKRQATGYAKICRTHFYLGCSYAEAAQHITSLLPDGWTWENYGKVWEIDHIIQLSDVDLTNRSELMRVCNYTNLRPLEVTKNRSRPRGLLAWQQKRWAVA